ncbi:MAG: hypothetical protein K9G41_10410 [Flavobacteriales bacterium]|nr:hypothetical protein [Flavobacteriales bacterium]
MIIRIADFNILIKQMDGHSIAVDEGYVPFLVHAENKTPDMVVHAYGSLPEQTWAETAIYSASQTDGELWNLSKIEDGYLLRVFDPEEPGTLQQLCVVSSNFREWKVYMASANSEFSSIEPLKYPLGPLLMYYLTVNHDAIMIHASAISDNGVGRLFTGVSGKGKSTSARLWFEAGAEVLNDDRLIIRKTTEGYRIYNTPMFYADEPRSAMLRSAYIIRHHNENVVDDIHGAEAVSQLLANCIQHGYDRKMMEHHLHFVSEMVAHISVSTLGFVPNKSVIETIRTHESRRADA